MDETARSRLIGLADAIYKFRQLEVVEQQWLLQLLNRNVKSTLEILDLISEKALTFEEIADEMDMNPQTISQKLNALAEGGYPLDLSTTTAFAPTGRPRKLAFKKKSKLTELKKLIAELEVEESQEAQDTM